MIVKTKLKSDDWFKSYGSMKYPLGSPLGAAILCILPSMHLMSKSTCGSCLDVCDFQQFSLHQIINYVKDKIGVVFLRSCVIFDTL